VCKIKGDIDSRVMDATEDDCISKVWTVMEVLVWYYKATSNTTVFTS
jgi:hypothetical protein